MGHLQSYKSFLIFLLFLTLTLIHSQTISSKAIKSYRSKSLVSHLRSNYSKPDLDLNPTINPDTYPSIIPTSRAMDISDRSSPDFPHDSAAEDSSIHEELNQLSGLGWGSHRSGSNSGHGSKYAHSNSNSNSNSYPSIAPRYSGEKYEKYVDKYDKYGSTGGNSNVGVGAGLGVDSGAKDLYSSYPYGHRNYHSYYSNPLLDYPYSPYYDRAERLERDRAVREIFNTKLNSALSPLSPLVPASVASAASSLFGTVVPPFDIDAYGDALALASGHGWGWKENDHHVDHYVSKVNTNAIGLLGLLGLLSLLSNVLLLLTTTTTTTTAAGRKKRSANYLPEDIDTKAIESDEARHQRLFEQVLPYLTPVAHARNGLIPFECTLQGVCLTNKLLVKEFGLQGRVGGSQITSAVAKLLGEVENGDGMMMKKKVKLAGLQGRNQDDCLQVYPVCMSMKIMHPHSVPFLIRMEEIPKLFQKFKKLQTTTQLL